MEEGDTMEEGSGLTFEAIRGMKAEASRYGS